MRKASHTNPEADKIPFDGPRILPVIDGQSATRALLDDETGSLCLFDRAAGIVFTLPKPEKGMVFDFVVLTSVTSNAHNIAIDSASGAVFVGALVNVDIDTSNAVAAFTPNGTSNDNISMNGTTTGGLVGTHIRVRALSSTRWQVEGINQGSGVVATPFSDT